MLALARDGLEEGIWLRAERQTGGRGRQGRSWEGQAGNLFASTLARCQPGDPPPASLALVAGIAVWDALNDIAPGCGLTLKWPNDIMAGRAKLCGMLLEMTGNAVVVGIGVNIAAHPDLPDRPTTSLTALGHGDADAARCCEAIARSFAVRVAQWRAQGLAPITVAWRERAHPAGTPLRIHDPDGSVLEGDFAGLDGQGNLILRLANGASHVMHAGDVFLM